MTALYSDNDKQTAIRNFIFARSKQLAQVKNYDRIREYLEEERVEILCKLKKSGERYARYGATKPYAYYYLVKDAQVYFEWLISVATETRKVSEEKFKKAINQLFMFIFDLDNLNVEGQTTLLKPYSVDKELANFDSKISKVQTKVERMNEQIVDALEKIMRWQQKYQPYLDRMKKDQDSVDKAMSRKGKNK